MADQLLKILLVDDSKIMRRIISSFLMNMGYEYVLEASSVRSALKVLEKEAVDLILCDYSMPGASGLELLKGVRADSAGSKVKFVMITAEAQLGQIIEAYRKGVHLYITKPFTQRYFEYVINKAVRG